MHNQYNRTVLLQSQYCQTNIASLSDLRSIHKKEFKRRQRKKKKKTNKKRKKTKIRYKNKKPNNTYALNFFLVQNRKYNVELNERCSCIFCWNFSHRQTYIIGLQLVRKCVFVGATFVYSYSFTVTAGSLFIL